MADHAPADRVGEVAVRAAQERLDPAHQLAQPERLGQVVVGAQLQADDLVDLVVAGGEHQDRHLGAGGAHAAEDLEPVDPGQADIEHDEVRRLVHGQVEALLARGRDGHLVALLLEGILDAPSDGVLVFDDEDGGGHVAMLHRVVPTAGSRGMPGRGTLRRAAPGASTRPARPSSRSPLRPDDPPTSRGPLRCPPPPPGPSWPPSPARSPARPSSTCASRGACRVSCTATASSHRT